MSMRLKAIILLVIGTMFWGTSFVFIKEAVSSISIYSFIGLRFLIAGLKLAMIFPKRILRIGKSTLKSGLVLGTILFLSVWTQTYGIQFTTASKAAFITGLSVVFVPLFLALIKWKFPGLKIIIASIVATCGLGLLTLSESVSLNVGDIWVLLCAVFFAIYIIQVSVQAKKYDAIQLTFVQLILIGVLGLIISIAQSDFSIPESGIVWFDILFTALFCTTFMFTIQNVYQKYVSEVTASLIYAFEPLFAAITAYFYLAEILGMKVWIGGLLIFLAMLLVEIRFKKS